MPRKNKRFFSVYHFMEQEGVFDNNTANIYAQNQDGISIYKKAEYPKMLYSPVGETVMTSPGELIEKLGHPNGFLVGQQFELVSKTVNDSEEEKAALSEGWKLTPGESHAAAGRIRAPANAKELVETFSQQAAKKRAEIKAQQAELEELERMASLPPANKRGPTVKPEQVL